MNGAGEHVIPHVLTYKWELDNGYTWTHIHAELIDTGDSKRKKSGSEIRIEKLLIGYNAHYLGDGYNRNLNSTTQYIHVTHLHRYHPESIKNVLKINN